MLFIFSLHFQVSFADFFLADQLTSQVQAFRCLEFYMCYYGMRWYQKEEKCHDLDLYNVFYIIIAVIPYWIRFLQVPSYPFLIGK